MNDLSSKIIAALIAVLLSVFAYEANRLLSEIRTVIRRQKLHDQALREFTKSIFTLLARLYPDKQLISVEMQKFFLRNDAFFRDIDMEADG